MMLCEGQEDVQDYWDNNAYAKLSFVCDAAKCMRRCKVREERRTIVC